MTTTLLVVLAISFVAGLAKSMLGFGDALVAMPLLAFVVDWEFSAPLVALQSGTIAVGLIVLDRRHVDMRSALWLFVAATPGIPLGLWLPSVVNESAVKCMLAGLIFAYSAYELTGSSQHKIESRAWVWPFGFAAGVLGGAYNMHGPPLVVYGTLSRWERDRFRTTLQAYFLFAGTAVLVGHGIKGRLTTEVWTTFAWSVPLLIVAMVAGRFFASRCRDERFRRYVYIGLMAMSLGLVWQAVRGGS